MKPKITHLIALSMAFLSASATAQALSLDELYQKVLQRSERIGAAELQVQRQAESIKEAEAQDSSRLQLRSSVDAAQNKIEDQAWQAALEPKANLELRHPIFDGGALRAKKAKSEALASAASYDLAQEQLRLKLEASKTFYDLLAAETDLKNLQASRQLYEKRLATLEQRQRIGRSRSSEVLAAKTQLQILLSQTSSAQTQLKLAQLRLSWLSGQDTLPSLNDQLNLETIRQSQNRLVPQALPALAAAKARTLAAEQEIVQQRAANRPKLDVIAAYNWARNNELSNQKLSAGLGLNWTLYEAGSTAAAVSAAAIDKQRAVLSEQEVQRQSELEYSLVQRNWTEGLQQVSTLEQAYEMATAAVKAQQQDYDNGLVTNLELMQAMDTQLQVRRNLDQAIFRCKQAFVEAQLRS